MSKNEETKEIKKWYNDDIPRFEFFDRLDRLLTKVKGSIPLEVEVEPLPKEIIIAQKLVDRLNDYQRQLDSDYGFVNKQKISYKVKELKKIIQIVQTV